MFLDYHLPPQLIAQEGVEPRDHSRLMVLHRSTGQLSHRRFFDLVEYLRPGDLLVTNQSRVIPARLWARNPQGTPIEVLLVREQPGDLPGQRWQAMLRPARRARGDLRLDHPGLVARVVEVLEDGLRLLEFSQNLWPLLDQLGQLPLPPYIHSSIDPERYQTVYARQPGSVAAPTAGLHFTQRLLDQLYQQGVQHCSITLHVGPGTFKPIAEQPQQHQMHPEVYQIEAEVAQQITLARQQGRRIVAVGTTVVRTLEAAWQGDRATGELQAGSADTQLYIQPGYPFRAVDALITNFHLPRSTLLLLVEALAGSELIRRAYQTAIEQEYRFYSMGDAMFIE